MSDKTVGHLQGQVGIYLTEPVRHILLFVLSFSAGLAVYFFLH